MNPIFHAVRLFSAASLIFAALVASSGLALADSTIRVKVDDQPITSYDIAQRARLLQLTGAKGGQKEATEELIDETLQFIEGAKMGMSVPESRVDQAIASIGQSMKMTPAQLKQALAGQGIDIATLRRRIKSQMLWQQLVQAKVRVAAVVKSSDITAALFQDGKAAEKLKTTEFTLQQIIFVIPNGSSPAYVAQRRREAESFRGRFAGCDNSLEQAKQLKGVVVRMLGRRTAEQLGGPDGKDIQNTPPGKAARPTLTPQGIEVVAVCSTRDISSDAAARNEIESKLMMEKNKDLGKDYLADLRKKALIEYR